MGGEIGGIRLDDLMADKYTLDAGITEVDAWLPRSPGSLLRTPPPGAAAAAAGAVFRPPHKGGGGGHGGGDGRSAFDSGRGVVENKH